MKRLLSILALWGLACAANAPAQTIVSQPQSLTVNNASSATFTVGATGATAYQWQFNGTNISGATASSLSMDNVASNEIGSYTVIVSGSSGSVTSAPPATLNVIPGTIVQFSFSGLLGSPSNTMEVQLFDHDKPVTVQNFIHYIQAGGYNNMFIDRVDPGFVLQGGDYGASNRTDSIPPLTGWFIQAQFTDNTNQPNPPYPPQINNEAGVGPFIHNYYGTLTMALGSDTNSANSAFFFNLGNNSGLLDGTNDGGPFVVFGRVIGGTNVLQYFNSVTTGNGAVQSANIIVNNGTATNSMPGVNGSIFPVNYSGSNAPANSNLVFVGLSFQTTPVIDTNPPTIAITSPLAGQLQTNGTVAANGVASDDFGIAGILATLVPQPALDGTIPNYGEGLTNYATGTANWTVTLEQIYGGIFINPITPGVYQLTVQAQDGAGNLSIPASQPLTNTAVLVNGNGTVAITAGAGASNNPIGYPFQYGSNYTLLATPGSNTLFAGWNGGGLVQFGNALNFSEDDQTVYTAMFVSNGIPNGMAIDAPAANEIITNDTFDITGTISNAPAPPVTITCQVYTAGGTPVGSPLTTTTSSSDWSVTAQITADGNYIVEATAVDSAGNMTLTTQAFQVSLVPEILAEPQSVTNNVGSAAEFTVVATNGITFQWQFNGTNIAGATSSTLTLENLNSNQIGDYTVIVSSANVSVTSAPPATLSLVAGTMMQFVISGMTNGSQSNVFNVELFDHDRPVTVQNFLHYIRSGAYTNTFFDKCAANNFFESGYYGAEDRTNTEPPLDGWDIAAEFNPPNTNNHRPFPLRLANESGAGGFISNNFGTLSMVLASSDTNSATSGFMFNLSATSATRDAARNTVFGRIVDSDGTNTLNYFNALRNDTGLSTNARFFDQALNITNTSLTSVPINQSGANPPANANLLFCDFVVPTNAPVDTNPPTLTVSSPAPGAVLANDYPVIQGTAFDDFGVAQISCILTPEAAPDGLKPNSGVAITNYAAVSSNWSVTLETASAAAIPPGHYQLTVQAQDGAGNLSPAVQQELIVTEIITNGAGGVTVTNMDAIGYPFLNGHYYILSANPDANWVFLDWSGEGLTSIAPDIGLPAQTGLVLTANFITNSMPGALAFTYPPADGALSTNDFTVTGTIANVPAPPVTVVLEIDVAISGFVAAGPFTNVDTTNFSFPITGLAASNYVVQVFATDQNGNTTVISENFATGSVTNAALDVIGPGTVTGLTNGEPVIIGSANQVTAIPASNGFFFGWSNGLNGSINTNLTQTFTNFPGVVYTAIFWTNNATNLIAFTYPTPNGIIGTNNFSLQGTISNAAPVQITANIFNAGYAIYGYDQLTTSGTKSWAVGLSGLRPGQYTVVAKGADSRGNSQVIEENFTVQVAGTLAIAVNGNGTVTPYANGANLNLGTNFQLTANPAPGQAFYNWSDGAHLYAQAAQNFTMSYGLSLTATFIPTNTVKGLTITYPPAKALLHTNSFTLKGKIATALKSAAITCQFFQSNGPSVGAPLTTTSANNWAINVTNLPVGNYVIQAVATNDDGKSTIVSQPFSILAFSDAQGAYSGLFLCTNQAVNATNSGFLTFTLSPYGVMTGKLEFPGYAPTPIFPLAWTIYDGSTGYVEFGATNFHHAPLFCQIFIDLTGQSNAAWGSISSSNVWSSELLCYHTVKSLSAATTPAVGRYMLNLQATGTNNNPVPGTNGAASVMASKNGLLAVSGMLPDNTKFSQSVGVSSNGIWPLYAVPTGVKTNGLLMGWQTFTNGGSCSGQLYWYKGPRLGQYYTNGVGLLTNVLLSTTGTNFVRPAANTEYTIIFQGGALAAPMTNSLSVGKAGQFTVPHGVSDKLHISLSASGAITGTFANPVNNKVVHFSGGFIDPVLGGSGFIADVDGQTGFFTITLTPP